MSVPACGGVVSMRGNRKRLSLIDRVWCTSPSMRRCFLIEGEETSVLQSKGRYTEVKPTVWCREESSALKTEREGKEAGS